MNHFISQKQLRQARWAESVFHSISKRNGQTSPKISFVNWSSGPWPITQQDIPIPVPVQKPVERFCEHFKGRAT